MIVELILAALVVTAAGGAVAAYRRSRRERAESLPALEAPRQVVKGELEPRDVVVHLATDYVVEAVASFREGGRPILVVAWLSDGASTRHLLVDLVERPRCVLAEERDASCLGRSIPTAIDEGGFELRLARRSAVRVSCEGSCDLPVEAACDVGIFAGPGGRKGVVVLSGERCLLLSGRAVTEGALQLLQGDFVAASDG